LKSNLAKSSTQTLINTADDDKNNNELNIEVFIKLKVLGLKILIKLILLSINS
jgi:hypothetical protein